MSNPHIDTLRGVSAHTAEVIGEVRPDQLEPPTPCTEWNMRELLNHTVGVMFGIAAGVSGEPAPAARRPTSRPVTASPPRSIRQRSGPSPRVVDRRGTGPCRRGRDD